MQGDIANLWNASYSTYTNLKTAYHLINDTKSDGSHRVKRNPMALALAAGIPLIGLGATLFETFQVRSYIKKMERQFHQFADETQVFMTKQVQFNKDVVKIYESLYEELDALSCDLDIVAYYQLVQKSFERWRDLTQTVLSGIRSNELTMKVLQEVLPLPYIKDLMKAPGFRNTLYTERPETVYTQGRLTLVNMVNLNHTWRYNFVLSLPTLKNTSIFTRYSVEQVGVKNNNTCFLITTPNEVYYMAGKFYAVTDENCYERSSSLKICLKPTADTSIAEHVSVPCLNKEPSCEANIVTCKTRSVFTTAGVLAFSEETIRAMPKGTEITTVPIVNSPNVTTAFYSWDSYKLLMIGDRYIQSIRQPILHIEMEPQSIMSWPEFLEQTAANIQRQNLSHLSQTLYDQAAQLERIKDLTNSLDTSSSTPQWYSGLLKWAGAISLLAWIITIIGLLLARYKFRLNEYKKQLHGRRYQRLPSWRDTEMQLRILAQNPNYKGELVPSAPLAPSSTTEKIPIVPGEGYKRMMSSDPSITTVTTSTKKRSVPGQTVISAFLSDN